MFFILTICLHCTLLTVYKIFFFILKGDYDVVINDYEKAKSLFGKTEVQVFKKCKACVLLLDLLSFHRKNVGCVLQRMLHPF